MAAPEPGEPCDKDDMTSSRKEFVFSLHLSLTLLGPGPVMVFRGTLMGSAREAGEETSRGITETDSDLVMRSRVPRDNTQCDLDSGVVTTVQWPTC